MLVIFVDDLARRCVAVELRGHEIRVRAGLGNELANLVATDRAGVRVHSFAAVGGELINRIRHGLFPNFQ